MDPGLGYGLTSSADVPPLSVAQGFRVVRHRNGLVGQLRCVQGGRQPGRANCDLPPRGHIL